MSTRIINLITTKSMATAKKVVPLKKTDVVKMVQEITQGTKVQATEIVESIFNMIAKEMAKCGAVDIAGFGKFIGKEKPARMARNPKTGESVKVAASRVAKFRASKPLKEMVASGK